MRRFLPKSKPDVRIEWTAYSKTPLVWGSGSYVFGYSPADLAGPRDFGVDSAVYSVDRKTLVTFAAITNFKGTGCFPVTWEWQFGDGGEAYGPSATHSYSTANMEGVQAVLTVTDNKGRKWRARKQMYINETAVRPMIVSDDRVLIVGS